MKNEDFQAKAQEIFAAHGVSFSGSCFEAMLDKMKGKGFIARANPETLAAQAEIEKAVLEQLKKGVRK